MKKLVKITLSLLVAGMVIMGLNSCQKQANDIKSAVTVVMDNSQAKSSVKADVTDNLSLDSGYIYVMQLKIKAKVKDMMHGRHMDIDSMDEDSCVNKQYMDVHSRINLVDGSFDMPVEFDLPEADYDDVTFMLHLNKYNEYHAVEIYGTYISTAGDPIPVAFIYDDNIVIKTDLDDLSDDDLVVTDSMPIFVVNIYPRAWFDNVSTDMMDNAQLTDGVLLISKDVNTDIYNAVVGKMFTKCRLNKMERNEFEHRYGWHD